METVSEHETSDATNASTILYSTWCRKMSDCIDISTTEQEEAGDERGTLHMYFLFVGIRRKRDLECLKQLQENSRDMIHGVM